MALVHQPLDQPQPLHLVRGAQAFAAGVALRRAVLTCHVVPGKVMAKDVRAGKVKSAQGSELTLTTAGGVKVDGANGSRPTSSPTTASST